MSINKISISYSVNIMGCKFKNLTLKPTNKQKNNISRLFLWIFFVVSCPQFNIHLCLLTGDKPSVVFGCCRSSIFKVQCLRMLRCFSAHHTFYILPGSSKHSGHFPLTSIINKVFRPIEMSMFTPYCINSIDCCV